MEANNVATSLRRIVSKDLRLEDVPAEDAEWNEVSRFCLTFSAYEAYGSFEAVAEIAKREGPKSLSELRATLFLEHRAWAHLGCPPDRANMQRIRGELCKIRERLAAGELE